jgi:hypothetical protein
MNEPKRFSGRRLTTIATILGGLAVGGLAGCGGSSAGDDTSSGKPSSSATHSSASAGGAGFTTTQCADAAAKVAKASEAFNPTATDDLGEGFASIEKELGAIQDAVSSGPVKEAAGRLKATYGRLASQLKGVKYSGSGTPPQEFVDAAKGLESPQFTADLTAISTYFAGGCKG